MIQRTDGAFTCKTFLAGANIAAYTICKFGSDDDSLVPAAAATDVLVAVSKEAVASGARGDFQMEGIGEVKLGAAGACTRGDSITADAAGLGTPLAAAATIKSCIGMAMASGANGDIIPVHINKWTAVTA